MHMSSHLSFVLALVAGLTVRLLALLFVDHQASAHDEGEYDTLAWNLVKQGTLSYDTEAPFVPAVTRVPVQPLMMAALFAIFGHKLLPARIFQIVLNLITGVVFYFAIGSWNAQFASVLLWLSMLSPFEAGFAPRLMTEPLSEFLLVLGFSVPWITRSNYAWLLVALIMSILVLTREVYFLLVPFVALALVTPPVKHTFSPHGFLQAFLIMLTVLVVIAPWTYRNYLATGQFIPLSKGQTGAALWVGTWEDLNHRWQGTPFNSPDIPYRDAGERALVETTWPRGGTKRNDVFLQLARIRLKSEPLRVISRWFEREPLLWFGTRCPFWFKPARFAPGTRPFMLLKGALYALNALIILLGVVGLAISVGRRSILLWFAVPIIYTAIIYFPFHDVETRYSQPIFLFVMMFALVAVWTLLGLPIS
jgi:hypothetical protein